MDLSEKCASFAQTIILLTTTTFTKESHEAELRELEEYIERLSAPGPLIVKQ